MFGFHMHSYRIGWSVSSPSESPSCGDFFGFSGDSSAYCVFVENFWGARLPATTAAENGNAFTSGVCKRDGEWQNHRRRSFKTYTHTSATNVVSVVVVYEGPSSHSPLFDCIYKDNKGMEMKEKHIQQWVGEREVCGSLHGVARWEVTEDEE